jgi:L-asparaginase
MAGSNRATRDGPRNLRAAIAAAAEPGLAEAGPTVVIGDLIHSPRYVRKAHKSALDAFTSDQFGTFGYVDDDLVHLTGRLAAPPRLAGAVPDDDAVQLIKAVPGMNGLLVRSAVDGGARGIVFECLPGRGGVPPRLADELVGAIEVGLPVVLAGEAVGRLWGNYDGSHHTAHYVRRGAIGAGDLYPTRARTLLTLLLAGGADLGSIRATFRELAP